MSPPALRGGFRRQIVVVTACVTALAMLLLAMVLQAVLADLSRSNVARVLEDRAEAVRSTVTGRSSGDGLEVPGGVLDAGVVVYDATGAPVAGSPWSGLDEDYAVLSGVTSRRYRDVDGTVRLVAEPFTTGSGARGVVVVGERLAPYEQAEQYALAVSLVTSALATVAAAAIAAWVTTRALRPVARLATTAADWSEHDLTKRFGLGPPSNELTGLAAVLDTLLDKVSTAIRSEQRLTSELAHELRTPLTAVQGTADLALLRGDLSRDVRADLEEISASAARMSTTIATLLELARSSGAVLDAGSSSLREVVEEVVGSVAPAGTDISVEPTDHRLAVPHAIAVRALTPLVENALRFADTGVAVTVVEDVAGGGGLVGVRVSDDGPGVGDVGRIFEPGVTTGGGMGLGLALARRMARSVDGDVVVVSRTAPTTFELRLPRVLG
ncbi:MAG: HAMP domain-containing sensor histidine kinase [Nocardioides sp.]